MSVLVDCSSSTTSDSFAETPAPNMAISNRGNTALVEIKNKD